MAIRIEWDEEKFYLPQEQEVDVFQRAHKAGQVVELFGPTGSGKNTLVKYMAGKLQRPLITIPGQRGVDAAQLIGSIYTQLNETFFMPGQLYTGIQIEAIIHLEEILEMEPDVLTLLHQVTDERRELDIKITGETLKLKKAMIVYSMNPGAGYQKPDKRFPKPSLVQRGIGMHLGYIRGPNAIKIIQKKSGCTQEQAKQLNDLAIAIDEIHSKEEHSGALPE